MRDFVGSSSLWWLQGGVCLLFTRVTTAQVTDFNLKFGLPMLLRQIYQSEISYMRKDLNETLIESAIC